MDIRTQTALAIRRQFGGRNEFLSYLRSLGIWAAFWIIVFRDWPGIVVGLVGVAIALIILVFKEGALQRELRRRRALPPSAIRGASN